MQKITFTYRHGLDWEYPPKPASEFIPEWYKKTPSYFGGKKDVKQASGTGSIKKCIPVFDAMTAGYILTTQCDVWVKKIDGESYYQWAMGPDKVAFHPVHQAAFHPNKNSEMSYPKWLNDWLIKTPKGYSAMFIPPMHNPNKYFAILPGIVDTDTYLDAVHFPFVLNDPDFEGLIPAGTPMVQVIPFKRTSWKSVFGGAKEIKEAEIVLRQLITQFFNRYKTMFWHRKEYK
jgi:hypothetical protein